MLGLRSEYMTKNSVFAMRRIVLFDRWMTLLCDGNYVNREPRRSQLVNYKAIYQTRAMRMGKQYTGSHLDI